MLPTELCNLIIDHLHDSKPSLLACSLVCCMGPQMPFSPLPQVRLNRDTADPFFQLFESPMLSSLWLIHASLMSPRIPLLETEFSTASLGIWHFRVLPRCPADVLEHVQKLSVTWIGWWTLSEAERLNIRQRFKNVTELALWMVYFQTDEEFQALVASFPALEVLSLQTIRFQVTDLEETHSHVDHTLPANLHTISLNNISNPRVIRSLIPCPSLRVFKCHFVNFDDFMPTLAKDFRWLLLSAGERSEDFGFTIQAGGLFNDGVDLDASYGRT
ncbi:hypothetical protein ARMSODRAFT_1021712 [Armillaria solidipes]|uniref:F-box domain-containing protein n=1 Tax=Armillaria solidipes TaxID=1076256 RepID=A0A2H3BGD0_9AGAR|nr:hypothetical protein ARMSODRAFT_1021712 [Armillaria solidipes]